jgi:hypothetical protein
MTGGAILTNARKTWAVAAIGALTLVVAIVLMAVSAPRAHAQPGSTPLPASATLSLPSSMSASPASASPPVPLQPIPGSVFHDDRVARPQFRDDQIPGPSAVVSMRL